MKLSEVTSEAPNDRRGRQLIWLQLIRRFVFMAELELHLINGSFSDLSRSMALCAAIITFPASGRSEELIAEFKSPTSHQRGWFLGMALCPHDRHRRSHCRESGMANEKSKRAARRQPACD